MSGLVNDQLIDATKAIVIVTFVATLLFTVSYLVRARWYRDPAGWAVAGDRVALVLILALIAVQSFVTFSLDTLDTMLVIEDACLLVTAIVSVVATIYLFRIRRKPNDTSRTQADHRKTRLFRRSSRLDDVLHVAIFGYPPEYGKQALGIRLQDPGVGTSPPDTRRDS